MNVCLIIAGLIFLTLLISIIYNYTYTNKNTKDINKNIEQALLYLNNNIEETEKQQSKIEVKNTNPEKIKIKGGNTIENMTDIKNKLKQVVKETKQNDSLNLQQDLNNIIELKEKSTLKTELIKDFKDKYKNTKIIDLDSLFINNDDINNKYLNRDIILSDKDVSEATNRLNIVNQNKLTNKKIIKPYQNMCFDNNNPDYSNNNEFSTKNKEVSERKLQEEEYKELHLDLEDKNPDLEPYGNNDFDNFSIFTC